ncbi:cyclase family protein [Micromonospora sp. SH-82]|uniref:cyclase family protein n=1 Tax=Micromonospora sp. SH-82 TaxID=3132938 RepID=UPI003EBA31B0
MDQRTDVDQWRVEFDADIEFSNGGALQVQGFRLDIPGTDIAEDDLGDLLVRHLGLLMVGRTVVKNKTLLREPHKGSRGVATATAPRRPVDLTGTATVLRRGPVDRDRGRVDLHGLVDLPGVLVRLTGSTSTTVDRSALVPYEVAGHAVVLHTGGTDDAARPRLTAAAATWLADQGAALVGADGPALDPVGDLLTGRGVPTLGHLTGLDRLPPTGFRLHAVPTDDVGGVRAYGTADGH